MAQQILRCCTWLFVADNLIDRTESNSLGNKRQNHDFHRSSFFGHHSRALAITCSRASKITCSRGALHVVRLYSLFSYSFLWLPSLSYPILPFTSPSLHQLQFWFPRTASCSPQSPASQHRQGKVLRYPPPFPDEAKGVDRETWDHLNGNQTKSCAQTWKWSISKTKTGWMKLT